MVLQNIVFFKTPFVHHVEQERQLYSVGFDSCFGANLLYTFEQPSLPLQSPNLDRIAEAQADFLCRWPSKGLDDAFNRPVEGLDCLFHWVIRHDLSFL